MLYAAHVALTAYLTACESLLLEDRHVAGLAVLGCKLLWLELKVTKLALQPPQRFSCHANDAVLMVSLVPVGLPHRVLCLAHMSSGSGITVHVGAIVNCLHSFHRVVGPTMTIRPIV